MSGPIRAGGDARDSSIQLVSLNARTTPVAGETDASTLAWKSDISIRERKSGTVRVRLSKKVYFKPSGPVEIDLEMDAECQTPDGLSEDELKAAIEASGYPLYAKASHIVAFVTEQMTGVPLVIPPFGDEGEGTD